MGSRFDDEKMMEAALGKHAQNINHFRSPFD